ncbi:MAG: cytochrome c [bacterium]|nr:cytochrome c [bacterium]
MTRRHTTAGLTPALASLLLALAVAGCGDRPQRSAGTAGTQHPAARPIDPAAEAAALDQGPRAAQTMALSDSLAAVGQALFDAKGCTGCHEPGSSASAPDLRGVATRRTEAWLRRQVTTPEWMAEHDPLTRGMVEQYGIPMADLDIDDDEATALLQYMLSEDGGR